MLDLMIQRKIDRTEQDCGRVIQTPAAAETSNQFRGTYMCLNRNMKAVII